MKILVIPDVHLKPWMFNEADKIDKNKYDRIVCLGDLVDDWNQGYNDALYERTLSRVLKFDKDHDNTFWCIGNHDFSYDWEFQESGFSHAMIPLIQSYHAKMREQMGDRLAVIHKIGDTLFSHAGLTYIYANIIERENLSECISTINSFTTTYYDAEKLWNDYSPLWARDDYYDRNKICGEEVWQVVGHTPVKAPRWYGRFLVTDTFSTWSDGKTSIGDEKFIIFDTETHTWEYA